MMRILLRTGLRAPSLNSGGAHVPLRAGLAAALALGLAACGATTGGPGPVTQQPDSPFVGAPPEPAVLGVEMTPERTLLTPVHLAGRDLVRVAVLLPFSASAAPARSEATHMLRAAELALFERGVDNVLLMPRDTEGTARGGEAAAEAAIADGADLIIGPLFAAAVRGASGPARRAGVPVISFSTDASVAGNGVYLLSFPPEEEVRRIVSFTASRGADRFAIVAPATPYGQLVSQSYRSAVAETGGVVTVEEVYSGGVDSMTQAARRLARAGIERLDVSRALAMTGEDWTPSEGGAFQAVLLPAGGDDLRMLAPAMLFADIDPLLVKFLGTSLWRNPATIREPSLANGWFAGPDPDQRARFEAVYESVFDEAPSRLAGLGYDAASLAALMAANGGRIDRAMIEDENGYLGVDGLFRLRADGMVERGLAVYTIRNGQFHVLDPAPESFDPSGRVLDIEPDDGEV
ncbi:penicillin-binding protein activator [Glycocaulis sp.]|uniref:penicillin-binding protein activator n=1 Tax=Glycocaulis sp. TaxID=1969725 RepID=UPI0025B89A5B|nr:penicillin-binding protein activator [Glycocaulis sp.]MCH8522017.1 penicillin-binding protein activator [Glycocaulis sp.]